MLVSNTTILLLDENLTMKEQMQVLANLTEEQIKKFTLEEANNHLEKFKELNNLVTSIWSLFELFEPGATKQRTLDLINNHASGIVIEQMKRFQALSSSLHFFSSEESLVKEDALSNFENYQTMARNYLAYTEYKTQLEEKQTFIETRRQSLLPEENSERCTM
ncbi:hypothetical protein [Legionella sp. 29fVS95]|uniref:hypothetical protein n=1 Tax=Legionella sp. 29fVS95 TaxID=3402813 RepID=UPI003AF4E358